MNRPQSPQSGFTLVEMLVVFVIVGLLSVLIFEGFVYVLSLRNRFVAQAELLQQGTLRRQWFMRSVDGLIADLPSLKRHRFRGGATGFSGFSVAALTEPSGVPTAVSWRLASGAGDSLLQYRSRGHGWWTVLRWPGGDSGFRYLGGGGRWYSRWPPRTSNPPAQLPVAIAVTVAQGGYRQVWISSPVGARRPRPYLRLFAP